MKNLANCGPREFMRQTAKIRHAVEKWLKLTDVLNIRDKLPKVADDLPEDERDKAYAERGKKVLTMTLDAIMDEHPDETADLLALCCFIDPEKADDYPMSDYLGAITEMVNNEDVVRFFTSLMRLARTFGLTA